MFDKGKSNFIFLFAFVLNARFCLLWKPLMLYTADSVLV